MSDALNELELVAQNNGNCSAPNHNCTALSVALQFPVSARVDLAGCRRSSAPNWRDKERGLNTGERPRRIEQELDWCGRLSGRLPSRRLQLPSMMDTRAHRARRRSRWLPGQVIGDMQIDNGHQCSPLKPLRPPQLAYLLITGLWIPALEALEWHALNRTSPAMKVMRLKWLQRPIKSGQLRALELIRRLLTFDRRISSAHQLMRSSRLQRAEHQSRASGSS